MRESFLARVTDVDDPNKRGRVKVECAAILPVGTELPDWVEPMWPAIARTRDDKNAGIIYPLTVDTLVELVATTSHASDRYRNQAMSVMPNYRWRFPSHAQDSDFPELFQTNYPDRRGILTPGGHYILFDDKESFVEVAIKDGGKVKIDSDGNVFITPKSGANVHLDDDAASANGVSRIGDKTAGHDHTASFVLLDSLGAPVSGTITISTDQDEMLEGSGTVKAGG